MAGDEELLAVDDQEMFAAALGDTPPPNPQETGPEKPEAEPKPEGEQPRDEHGRFAPKDKEAEAETPAGEKSPLKDALSSLGEKSPPEDAIPSWRLREETQRRREAEERLAAREAQLQHYLQQIQRQQPPPKLPDLIEQPEAYAQALREQIRQEFVQEVSQREAQREQREIARSLHRADKSYGEEFRKAYEAFNSPALANDERLLEQIRNSYDQGEAILEWYRENDPKARRDKLKAELLNDPEFRKEFAGALRSQATIKPSNVTSLPNLTRAPGSAGNASDDWPTTDAGIFSSVTAGLRNR
jgi:hypothetical protein